MAPPVSLYTPRCRFSEPLILPLLIWKLNQVWGLRTVRCVRSGALLPSAESALAAQPIALAPRDGPERRISRVAIGPATTKVLRTPSPLYSKTARRL